MMGKILPVILEYLPKKLGAYNSLHWVKTIYEVNTTTQLHGMTWNYLLKLLELKEIQDK